MALTEKALTDAFWRYVKAVHEVQDLGYPPERVEFIKTSFDLEDEDPDLLEELENKWDEHEREVVDPALDRLRKQHCSHEVKANRSFGYPCPLPALDQIEIKEVNVESEVGTVRTHEVNPPAKIDADFEYQFIDEGDRPVLRERFLIADDGSREEYFIH